MRLHATSCDVTRRCSALRIDVVLEQYFRAGGDGLAVHGAA
jgi:hypothetical protein